MTEVTVPAPDYVAKLFLACFQRAPEYQALQYWTDLLESLRTASDPGVVPDSLARQQLCTYVYLAGTQDGELAPDAWASDPAFITQLYSAVLGRAPDTDGHAYWLSVLAGGATRPAVLDHFLLAIEDDPRDQAYLAHRTEVALAFARWENSNAELLPTLAYDAAEVLDGVDERRETIATAEQRLASYVPEPPPPPPPLPPPPPPPSESFALTIATDTIRGSSGDDVFTGLLNLRDGALDSTLTAGDTLDGRGGRDTFVLTLRGDNSLAPSALPTAIPLHRLEQLTLRTEMTPGATLALNLGTLFTSHTALETLQVTLQEHFASSGARQQLELDLQGLTPTDITLANEQTREESATRISNHIVIKNLIAQGPITVTTTQLDLSLTVLHDSPPLPSSPQALTLSLGEPLSDNDITLGRVDGTAASFQALTLNHTTTGNAKLSLLSLTPEQSLTLTGGSSGALLDILNFIEVHDVDASALQSDLRIRLDGDTRDTTITSGDGNDDIVVATQGVSATLNGGSGNDRLVAGYGNDTLTGGSGADIFGFRPGASNGVKYLTAEHVLSANGTDTITDFSLLEGDKLAVLSLALRFETDNAGIWHEGQADSLARDSANVLIFHSPHGADGALDAAAIDALAASADGHLRAGFVMLQNGGVTELWYDQNLRDDGAGTHVFRLAILEGFTDLPGLTPDDFLW